MKNSLKHSLLVFFSLILLLSTLFVQTNVENKEQLRSVKFGHPIAFISQDHSYYKRVSYPSWDRFDFKKIDTAKNFNPVNFVASFLSIFLVLEVIIYLLESLDFWVRKKFFNRG